MLIQLLVILFLIGLGLWAITQFPLDNTIRQIIRVILIVVAVLAVLDALGVLPSGIPSLLRA